MIYLVKWKWILVGLVMELRRSSIPGAKWYLRSSTRPRVLRLEWQPGKGNSFNFLKQIENWIDDWVHTDFFFPGNEKHKMTMLRPQSNLKVYHVLRFCLCGGWKISKHIPHMVVFNSVLPWWKIKHRTWTSPKWRGNSFGTKPPV